MSSTVRFSITFFMMAFMTIAISSCSDDDGNDYPPIITEFLCANTNAEGIIQDITLDNGRTYPISQDINAGKSDTTLRCMCSYTLTNDCFTVYSIEHVYSREPKRDSVIVYSDPVKFISAYRSSQYLNISIGIMTSGVGGHSVFFHEDSISEVEGMKKAYFTLSHRQPSSDKPSYTEDTYLSMPLWNYTDCDSISFTVNTFEGTKTMVYH